MKKEEIIAYARANGASPGFVRRFTNDETLTPSDLRWAYEHYLDLGYEVYLRAVEENGLTLPYVPEEHRTYELCMAAVKSHGLALPYVPKEHRTYELCMAAVKREGFALQHVPEHHRTPEIRIQAVK